MEPRAEQRRAGLVYPLPEVTFARFLDFDPKLRDLKLRSLRAWQTMIEESSDGTE